jgi:D-alanine-D-alanine ligase
LPAAAPIENPRIVVVHNADSSRPDVADVANQASDVARGLVAGGARTSLRAVPGDDPLAVAKLVAELRKEPPDLVFNLVESLDGDPRHEAVLPHLCELAGLAYTGSPPLGLGMALHKDVCKRLLLAAGVSTPQALVVEDKLPPELPPFPLIVKPTREDASVGISDDSVVTDRVALERRVESAREALRQPLLVERFIPGRELYVSLVGAEPRALPMHEVDFSDLPADRPRIVSYEAKWDRQCLAFHATRSVRAVVDEATAARCVSAARAAFAALGLRDYARIDLRVAADGTPFVIDVNPNCDLSDGAGFCRAASFAGIDYPGLLRLIVEAALSRQPRKRASRDPDRRRRSAADTQLSHSSNDGGGPGSDPRSGAKRRPVQRGGDRGGVRAGRRGPGQPRR